VSSVTKRDYYEVLGLDRQATDQQIKSAYRKMALKYHPDRNPGDHKAEEAFKEAAEAYSVLADREKRSLYDRFGHAGVAGAGAGRGWIRPNYFCRLLRHFSGLGDVFGFGDLFGQRRRRGGPQRGADLRYDLEISFEESASGTETSIQIPREETCETCKGSGAAEGTSAETCSQCRGSGQLRYQQGFLTVARPCPNCRGTGKTIAKPCQTCRGAGRVGRERKLTVKIPAGIATGQRLRLYGEGEHGSAGGPPGDLYVVVHVQEHSFFHREEDDLYCEMPISFPTLALGGSIHVPTLDGREQVQVPAGTQPGTRFKLRGKGMPHVNGRGQGDLYAIARVAVPKKLTKEQKHALEELNRLLPQEKLDEEAGSEEKAVLRTRQRHLWVSIRHWTSPSPPARGREPFRTCCTPSSMRSSRSPIQEHESGDGWRVFFRSAADRNAARGALASEFGNALRLAAMEIDDEDWARRSQASLTAIRVGRIIVAPPWDADPGSRTTDPDSIAIVIDPSTGFGTGHHASTRLCLELLQKRDVRGLRVIDVGTGQRSSRACGMEAWCLSRSGDRH
jgi:molecular chaperone DnaJ